MHKIKVKLNGIFANNERRENLFKGCVSYRKSKIFCCKAKGCKFQSGFYPPDKILRSVTKRTYYDCVTLPRTIWNNCHSSNIIIRITCDKFQWQDVGQTVQTLNKRPSWHR